MGSDHIYLEQSDTTVQAVWDLLSQVTDPEIPVVSIRELGILRDVQRTQDGAVEVTITPTYSGCPAMGQIEQDVRAALAHLGAPVRVRTQLAPAWTTNWMSESAKQKLREYGIAPPMHGADPNESKPLNVIQFAPKNIAAYAINKRANGQFGLKTVPCPRCNSANTIEISHFASTACKALYKCLDCLEPFDYFKPY
jgi:ring-1,2-phenylacetyl-CoA epoxidase subunit PaaD